MKKIKVAHILDSVGGVEVYLRLITERIDSDLVENIIIHNGNSKKKKYYSNSNSLIKEFNIEIQREINILKDLKVVVKTIKILKKERPDIIHAHSAKGGIVARMASLFYKVNVLHTPHAYSYLSTDNKVKKKTFLLIESFFRRFNSYLLATSESELNRGIYEVGYKIDKTILFNNSILPIEILINQGDGFKLPTNYICSVGRPSYQKNIEMMVEVVREIKKEIPNIHLVLMGVGEYSPNKKQVNILIEKYDLKNNITLIDWIEREKIFNIIFNSKLYISTSRYEGLPYSIIESLALSKACVVTNCDGNRDLVKNNHNGFLIDDEDVNEMKKKILELLNNDELRQQFEINSLEYFNKYFNLNTNIQKLENIYKRYSKN